MDVNVHPTKMELRFSKNEFVYRFVLETVKECLANRELAARVKLPDPVKQQQFTKSPENIKQNRKILRTGKYRFKTLSGTTY